MKRNEPRRRRPGRPRKDAPGVPPGLAEDPELLAGEAAAVGGGPDSGGARSRDARRRKGPAPWRGSPDTDTPGAAAPTPMGGEVQFPVEALAVLHLEIWNAMAVKLRSRWQLSREGAAEMARY